MRTSVPSKKDCRHSPKLRENPGADTGFRQDPLMLQALKPHHYTSPVGGRGRSENQLLPWCPLKGSHPPSSPRGRQPCTSMDTESNHMAAQILGHRKLMSTQNTLERLGTTFLLCLALGNQNTINDCNIARQTDGGNAISCRDLKKVI